MESRLVKIQHKNKRAWVYPEEGFNLYGFEQDFGKKTVQVIYAPERKMKEPSYQRYGNPILFPTPSMAQTASQKGAWKRNGRTFPMPFHGFARNSCWQITDIRKDRVSAVLIANAVTGRCFPFRFNLKATYRLDARGLVLDMEVKNTGRKRFTYALGLHPYIKSPLGPKGTVKDVFVKVPPGKRFKSKDKWYTYYTFKTSEKIIRGDAYLKGSFIITDIGKKYLDFHDSANGYTARVSVEGSKVPFPYWVVWSESRTSPFMCMEPWSTIPNGLNFKKTRSCKPKQVDRYQMIISVR